MKHILIVEDDIALGALPLDHVFGLALLTGAIVLRHRLYLTAATAAEELLAGRGACRIHGGGFAGTIQAFVPLDQLEDFTGSMEALAGPGTCHVLSIRSAGSVLLAR